MKPTDLFRRIFPDSPVSLCVVEVVKDGLRLDDGSTICWADDEVGVVLQFDDQGELQNEWWEADEGYSDLMNLFKLYPGPGDIQERPRLRVVGFDDEEIE